MFTGIDRLTEQGCSTTRRDKVCRSRGGESCAFDGAMIALQPLADSVHLVHGPIACCGNSWESRGSYSDKGELHKWGFTTAMDHMDIVYGSEGKLLDAIRKAVRYADPKAVFVYATCVSGLIGEDIEAVCKRAEAELFVRVIPVNAPGFVGPKNLGNRIAGECLLEHVIGTGEPPFALKGRYINLIGEFNIAGDLNLIESSLKEVGVDILARITGNGSFQEITYAHRAHLNVLVCSRALINVAKTMRYRYGIPYIETSFFGSTETASALRHIGRHLGISPLTIETVIDEQESKLRQRLQTYSALRGKRAMLYGGGVKSWSFVSALRDLGIEVTAVGIKKSTYEDEEKIKALFEGHAPIFSDTSAGNMKRLYKETASDMLIAGSRNLYIALKEGWPYVDINQERHTAFASYEGLVNLAHHIDSSIRFYERAKGRCDTVDNTRLVPYVIGSLDPDNQRDQCLQIDPLGHCQSLGVAIAAQGFDRALAVLHSAQGCSFLSKALLTRHFKEPMALMSTKLFTEDVVMGSEDKLIKVIEECIEKQHPELILIISSTLAEVKGDDIQGALRDLRKRYDTPDIVLVSAPDYGGCIEEGYASALRGIIQMRFEKFRGDKRTTVKGQINIIGGSYLTPADFTELKEIVLSFGLKPILIPDMSCLEGTRQSFSALAIGGLSRGELDQAIGSELTIALSPSLKPIAEWMEADYNIPYVALQGVGSLRDADRLCDVLSVISARDPDDRFKRQRDILINGMRNAHFYLSPARVALALETDHAISLCNLLWEMASEVTRVIVPRIDKRVSAIKAKEVLEGSFSDLKDVDADIVISNYHGIKWAKKMGVAHYQAGIPSEKMLGYANRVTVGYRGALQTVNDIANQLLWKVQES